MPAGQCADCAPPLIASVRLQEREAMLSNRLVVSLAFAFIVALVSDYASTTQSRKSPYEVVVKGASLLCQGGRLEFYLSDPSAKPGRERTYLGTCFTPKYIVRNFHVSGDSSCYAISEDETSIVYMHYPQACGGGKRATRKPGGIYLHSVRDGDRLLDPDSQVNQIWGGTDIGPHALRVEYVGTTPSKGGARCSQQLVINSDGTETPEGEADTQSIFCRVQ